METTLRDTISALTDKAEAGEPLTVETPETVVPSAPTETPATPTATPETEGRTAGRARDEKGRLLPGAAAKPEPVARPDRPSSWKKEMWEHYDKLDPEVAKYIVEREGQYAKGVSTYKTEWEQAKPLLDAIAPYVPDLQKAGVAPAQAISRLAETHKQLVFGTPQQKLQLFSKLAQDYQVPLQALYDPQFAQQFALQPQTQQVPFETLIEQKLSEHFSKQAVVDFGAAKGPDGNPLYPHYETVRNKMAQLLEAGIANDLTSAYHTAIKLDDELWKSEQESKVKADEALRLEAQRKQVQVAKGNAISPKSATPASTGAGAKKGLRDQLSSNFDEVTGGRV